MEAGAILHQDISISGDPLATARLLVKNNGLKRALQIAVEGTSDANEQGDYYRLSVWREVKRILREGVKIAA